MNQLELPRMHLYSVFVFVHVCISMYVCMRGTWGSIKRGPPPSLMHFFCVVFSALLCSISLLLLFVLLFCACCCFCCLCFFWCARLGVFGSFACEHMFRRAPAYPNGPCGTFSVVIVLVSACAASAVTPVARGCCFSHHLAWVWGRGKRYTHFHALVVWFVGTGHRPFLAWCSSIIAHFLSCLFNHPRVVYGTACISILWTSKGLVGIG